MRPLGEAAGMDPPVHKWSPTERAEILAELDAAFFLLYGLDREDVQHILGTFRGLGPGRAKRGRFSTRAAKSSMPTIDSHGVPEPGRPARSPGHPLPPASKRP